LHASDISSRLGGLCCRAARADADAAGGGSEGSEGSGFLFLFWRFQLQLTFHPEDGIRS
jgi:hypothetical protein